LNSSGAGKISLVFRPDYAPVEGSARTKANPQMWVDLAGQAATEIQKLFHELLEVLIDQNIHSIAETKAAVASRYRGSRRHWEPDRMHKPQRFPVICFLLEG
jgi:hypothetical protein